MSLHDKPTSFDIAALAGVSQPTVSRALRGDPIVSEATRLRVQAIARQLNYKVDKAASSLRRGHSNTLALLFFEDPLPDGSAINPFFLSMLGSILHTCAARGYDLLTSFQELAADWHVEYEDSRKADGLILLGYGDYSAYRARLEQLTAQQTHFVRWGAVDPGAPGVTIGCDNDAGGRAAGSHLIASGRRRIAFLGAASDHYPEFKARHRGLVKAMKDAGLSFDPALQVDALSLEQDGYRAALELLARDREVDAVFAASDLIAIGAMRAFAAQGLSVPRQIAVVGFDDIPAAQVTSPPLTTIAQDYRRAGEMLVDALVQQINKHPADARLLAPHLIVRGSG